MSIHVLPPEIASQIAAGEIVERPVSVVKELLENSLDAGAHSIVITIEGAGKRLIEVADDGCGISAGEITLAVARHATSKLSRAEDLSHIETLGFRGEALASIGSVSIMTLTSQLEGAGTGARLRIEGGKVRPVETIGAPVGTVVRVEDLFYNVPARLKFLKSDSTERSQIDLLVTHYALAYPGARFLLKQEGRTSLQTSGNGNSREVLGTLYGVAVARQMFEVVAQYDNLKITGFISPISLTRSNRREITFFVNGRPVQDPSLSTALIQAYHNLIMVGRFPMAILFIELPPDQVDVNVHPAKAEVRFRQRDELFSGVQRAVRRALLAYTPVPQAEPSGDSPRQWKLYSQPADRQIDPAWEMAAGTEPAAAKSMETPQAGLADRQPGLPVQKVPILRLVGQVASTYLIAEGPDGLYLVDQHAAHERVLFERFMAQRGSQIASQALLQPATVELPPASARLLSDQIPLLNKLGFQVEPFGSSTFLVRAMPALLSASDPISAIKVVVEEFEEDETPLQAEIEARVIARVCKRAAVKGGQTLSQEEQQSLLRDLENCQSPRTCPHGRPTMIHLSVDLLERQFGRKGAR
ncbi:MAG: DNA mismatch repair endonuclease MutL [Omnitrophica WOR_2 bacterium]